ncbi:MAG: hypothetical protein DBY32_09185 [Phascolarctobacterium sp.]|nr:MAG: hypothetical protein DBY32_09185 [Phascolarctobacterium sp.]
MAHYYFENKPQPIGKSGKRISSSLHHDYICREQQYAGIRGRDEDLVYKASGNLPAWAKGDANTFWAACEANKPANYRAYREFKFSLQEELSLEDNIAMVKTLIERSGIGANHAYTFAIHDKAAAFDPEHRNIHCHLMFNEKIIEPGRPLAADAYFAKYAINKYGEPTGGYKTSREFISKQKTYELRTMWADICNAKFAERGIKASVDERTLAAQKDELLALGRTDEAEYFDREPAPHLGSAYRNPKTMEKIREKIEQLESCPEDESYNFDAELTENTDAQSEKILAFAKDYLLRKLGKAIQIERERLFNEMQSEKAEDKEQEELSYAVTAGDLTERLTTLITEAEEKENAFWAEYKELKNSIIKDDYIKLNATYAALGDEGDIYRSLRLDYSAIKKEIDLTQKERDTAQARAENLRGDISSISEWQAEKETYNTAKNKLLTLFAKRAELGKKIAVFKHKLSSEEMSALIAEYTEEIKDTNKEAAQKAKDVYRKYKFRKDQAERYADVLRDLSKLNTNTVIFASKIPPALQPYTKILGTTPVSSLDKITANKETYYILQKNDKDNTALAVKLNDDIVKGKAAVYTLTISKDTENKTAISDVKLTGKISTYAQNSTLKKQAAKGQAYPSAVSAVNRKITEIASKLTEDKNMRIEAYWQDERAAVRDKLQEAEQKMTQGWSL